MKNHEIVRETINCLNEYGWTQCGGWNGDKGNRRTGKFCLEGALMKVLGLTMHMRDGKQSRDGIELLWTTCVYRELLELLNMYRGRSFNRYNRLHSWNDNCIDAAEVIKFLKWAEQVMKSTDYSTALYEERVRKLTLAKPVIDYMTPKEREDNIAAMNPIKRSLFKLVA